MWNTDVNTLSEKIKLIQKELQQKVDFLNSGGCVHFAYFFSNCLKKFNIKHEIVLLDTKNPLKRIKNKEGISHVVVYIPNIGYIDGYSTAKKVSYKYIINFSDKKLNYIRHTQHWNWAYNSHKYNRLVGRIINKYMNEN